MWLKIMLLPVAFLCYKLSITHTIADYRQYRDNRKIAEDKSALSYSRSAFHDRHAQIREIFKKYTLDTASSNGNLLSFVTEFCDNSRMKLLEYQPYKDISIDNIHILTRKITVEGNFSDCLQLVYSLETQASVGKISSVSYKANEMKLTCTIYVQNII